MNEFPNIANLVMVWQEVRSRTLLARHRIEGNENPHDYWTELRLGTEIAREVQSGRWVVVAALLRLGAVESWALVGDALDMTGAEALDGFRQWLTLQDDQRARTGRGLSIAQNNKLLALAEAVEL